MIWVGMGFSAGGRLRILGLLASGAAVLLAAAWASASNLAEAVRTVPAASSAGASRAQIPSNGVAAVSPTTVAGLDKRIHQHSRAHASMRAPAFPVPGSSWRVYGADLSNTRSNPSGPAPSAVSGLSKVWEFDSSDGDFTGTPIVADGTVFLGSNGVTNNGNTTGQLIALSEKSGALLWKVSVDGPVNSSAAYANGRVYFGVARPGSPYVIALDAMNGHVFWKTTLTTQPESDSYASPQIFDGDVIIGTSALFGETRSSTPPTVRGSVVRLNGVNGATVWQTFTVAPGFTGGGVWTTAAVDPSTSTIFVGTGNAYQAPADSHTDAVLALDFATGRILRFYQATSGDTFAFSNPAGPDYDFGASPNLFQLPDGTAAVGDGQKSGVYWAFDRATLTPRWKQTVSTGSGAGGILGSTAFNGSRIFGPATVPGEVWSLNRDGGYAWLEPSPDLIKWGPVSYSNGVVYAASSAGFLQAWNSDGVPLTEVPLGASSFGGVSIAGGTVFVSVGTSFGSSGAVEAFRAS